MLRLILFSLLLLLLHSMPTSMDIEVVENAFESFLDHLEDTKHEIEPSEPTIRRTTVSEEASHACHSGLRSRTSRRCPEYVNEEREGLGWPWPTYPTLDKSCYSVSWATSNKTNNFGNCFNMTTDKTYRYITSNNVPDFYMNAYCPIGIGFGYCTKYEIEHNTCPFTDLVCGHDNGPGSHGYGDVWIPAKSTYRIPLVGDPTRPDRPFDMYDGKPVGGLKSIGPATGVAINGISIQGPNDAGAISIDEGGFQLTCGGHVTPPLGKKSANGDPGPGGPPLYHFHKSPECLQPFRNASIEVSHDGRPYEHGKLMGWAMDGFGIYSYQDIGGAAPIVDECGGHFGPVDESGRVEYHYHSRPTVPYHLACQGPSLGKCKETQKGSANFCHPGCGYDVCVQVGTLETELTKYLSHDGWDPHWLGKHTVNPYKNVTEV